MGEAKQFSSHCLITETETNGRFRCTRAAGHEGPCAAKRLKKQDIRHRRPGPKYMTRSNDLCTVAEAYLIAELVMRRGSLWRRAIRLILAPVVWIFGHTAEKVAS